MLKNIYTPLAGALSQERALETIANNLANVNTVGFKGDRVSFKMLAAEPYDNYPDPLPPANYKVNMQELSPLVGNELSYVGIADISKDYSQGPAITTHNKFDLMIEGEGFFQVLTPEGVRYQRGGDLSVSNEGALVNKFGEPILGEKGLIQVRSQDFQVNPKGEIYQDGQLVDQIQIMKFKDPTRIEHIGGGKVFFGGSPDQVEFSKKARIQQGFLEGSNVNPMKNLTAMIVSHRSYEAYQKAVSNYDKIMDKSSNTIGEVRA
ncbi:MAG: flagellar hook-basal body protein [Pseudobacteriovorax sp.]|nr:flagellar hook-basal body protein [Pseudobacteriovorax sp.]